MSAYAHCRDVTRASATNFYYGIRLLPRRRREALFAVYALARRIDDVADGDLPAEERLRGLAAERRALERLDASSDPVHRALADARRRYPIPLDAFGDLADGAEMDVRGETYATFDELVVYCRRVGGSIGRLALGVFRVEGPRAEAERLADDLGVALQLTNILRDVREDLAGGRLYLPREDLDRFGVSVVDGELTGPVAALVRFEAARAEAWFDRGLTLLPRLDRASATCVAAMAGIYRRLLERIEDDPEVVLRERVSLTAWEKGWVAARSLLGAAA